MIILLTLLLAANTPTAAPRGVSALEHQQPTLHWKFALAADMNCDSRLDQVYVARDRQYYYVGVVLAPISENSAVSFVRFRLSGDSQDALCGKPRLLRDEPLDEELDGYKCKGLMLQSGECDSFHLYWNHDANELDWWRL